MRIIKKLIFVCCVIMLLAGCKKEEKVDMQSVIEQEKAEKEQEEKEARLGRERRLQEAMLDIKKKYGKNAVLKGLSLMEGATAMERNRQIGGHKA